ncbi:hypothetical protein RI129_007170 [Pyrocoelia pectoralis]|uniref:THO complex subunit 7 homolog n=1 Tax=Pyrocoelia pectoralis TaxID=417401 RepID=A0AAN7ZEQ2_9COLE
MSDEEVIRRKLLIDGDGTGDDRRLNVLLKNFFKWGNFCDETSTEFRSLYDRMLAQIDQCESAARRSQIGLRANGRQQQKGQQYQKKLERQINDCKKTIEVNKQNLVQAKVLKQNRMMYDLLAQSIKQQPARKDTDKRLADLKAELNQLRDQKTKLEQKLEMRKKLFHVSMSSMNQLRSILEEDDITNTSLDDITNSPEPMSE